MLDTFDVNIKSFKLLSVQKCLCAKFQSQGQTAFLISEANFACWVVVRISFILIISFTRFFSKRACRMAISFIFFIISIVSGSGCSSNLNSAFFSSRNWFLIVLASVWKDIPIEFISSFCDFDRLR